MGILITGMHRSGTSLVAGLVNSLGIPMGTGPLMPTSIDNPRGFFERADVMNVNDEFLEALDGGWSSPPPISHDTWFRFTDEEINKYRDSLELFGLNSAHWFVKDPRICLLMPMWDRMALQALPTIFVIRNPLEVAQSLKLRNSIPHRHGLALWTVYMNSALINLPQRNNLILDYQSVIQNKQTAINKIEKFIKNNVRVKTSAFFGMDSLEDLEISDIQQSQAHDAAATYEMIDEKLSRNANFRAIQGIAMSELAPLINLYETIQGNHGQSLETFSPIDYPDWVHESLYESRRTWKLQKTLAEGKTKLEELNRKLGEEDSTSAVSQIAMSQLSAEYEEKMSELLAKLRMVEDSLTLKNLEIEEAKRNIDSQWTQNLELSQRTDFLSKVHTELEEERRQLIFQMENTQKNYELEIELNKKNAIALSNLRLELEYANLDQSALLIERDRAVIRSQSLELNLSELKRKIESLRLSREGDLRLLVELQREYSSIATDHNEALETISALENVRTIYENELTILRTQSNEMNSTLQNLRIDYENALAEQSRSQDLVAQLELELSENSSTLNQYQSTIGSQEAQLQVARSDIYTLSADREKHLQDINSRDILLAEYVQKIQSLQENNSQISLEISTLEGQVSSLQREREKSIKLLAAFELDLSSQREQITRLVKLNESWSLELDSVKEDFLNVSIDRTNLLSELEIIESENLANALRIQELISNNNLLDETLRRSSLNYSSLLAQHESSVVELDLSLIEIENLKETVFENDKEIELLVRKLTSQQSLLDAAYTQYEKVHLEVRELNQKLALSQVENRKLEGQVSHLRGREFDLSLELSASMRKNLDLSNELESSFNQITSLSKSRRELHISNQILLSDLNKLRMGLVIRSKEEFNLLTRIFESHVQINGYKDEISALSGLIAAKNAEIDRLKFEINESSAKQERAFLSVSWVVRDLMNVKSELNQINDSKVYRFLCGLRRIIHPFSGR